LDQIYNETKVRPRQYEFARLNLNYTVMSKRKLQLVQENVVNGWDDPRMPTISGLRRRGYTAAAIASFVKSLVLQNGRM
jgi:glutaminyl-tRNA synthetase